MLYAEMVDDAVDNARMLARQHIDEALGRPLDPDELEQYKRDTWGMAPAQIREQMAQDEALADVTYE